MAAYERLGSAITIKQEVNDYDEPFRFSSESLLGLGGNRFLSVVVGASSSGEIVNGSIYGPRGIQAGAPFRINTEDFALQNDPDTALLTSGRPVAVWHDTSLDDDLIKLQLLGPNGEKAGPERLAGNGFRPDIAALKGGGFVVSWLNNDDGISVQARLFDEFGRPAGSVFTVSRSSQTGDEKFQRTFTDVAALPNGGFAISWSSFDTGTDRTTIHARTFNASGKAVSGDIVVDSYVFSPNAGGISAPSVTALTNGNYVVSWTDFDDYGVKAQIYAASGAKVGAQLGKGLGGDNPLVVGLADGGFLIGAGTTGRVYDARGTIVMNDFSLTTPLPGKFSQTRDLAVNSLPDGGFVVTWRNVEREDDETTTLSNGAQFFLPSSAILETKGATVAKSVAAFEAYQYTVTANTDADVNKGVSLRLTDAGTLDIADELEGLRGATVYASDKGNAITTGSRDDRLYSGTSEDKLNGGAGNDRYYVNNERDIIIDSEGTDEVLTAVSYKLGDAAIEALRTTNSRGFSAINLTGNGSDQTIEGNRGANRLEGGRGSDVLNGGRGRDTLNGGAGNDQFFFNTSLDGKSNVDAITDFDRRDDTIVLGSNVFNGLKKGVLEDFRFKLIENGTSTKGVDKDDRILYDKAQGDLYFDADGSEGTFGRIKFAELLNDRTTSSSDFLIV